MDGVRLLRIALIAIQQICRVCVLLCRYRVKCRAMSIERQAKRFVVSFKPPFTNFATPSSKTPHADSVEFITIICSNISKGILGTFSACHFLNSFMSSSVILSESEIPNFLNCKPFPFPLVFNLEKSTGGFSEDDESSDAPLSFTSAETPCSVVAVPCLDCKLVSVVCPCAVSCVCSD